jgi:hypothetical protein
MGQFESIIPQGLKPSLFCRVYVRAKARTLQAGLLSAAGMGQNEAALSLLNAYKTA